MNGDGASVIVFDPNHDVRGVGSHFSDVDQPARPASTVDINVDPLMRDLAAMPATSGPTSLVLGAAGHYGESIAQAYAAVQLVDDLEAQSNDRRHRNVTTRKQVLIYASAVAIPTIVGVIVGLQVHRADSGFIAAGTLFLPTIFGGKMYLRYLESH